MRMSDMPDETGRFYHGRPSFKQNTATEEQRTATTKSSNMAFNKSEGNPNHLNNLNPFSASPTTNDD